MNNLMVIDQNANINIWESSDQLTQIKEIYGKNLSNGEFTTFVQIGKATGLNPFLREIWAVKYGSSPASIFIGRDGYRKSAQSHTEYDYHQVDAIYSNDTFENVNGEITHKYNFKDRGDLIGAYCIVKRRSSSKPIFALVELKEYSTNKSLWSSQGGKPVTMIKKVAESQGLRMAFQELFSGTYHESENWHQDDKKTQRGVTGLKEKLGINEPVIEHDIKTGEIIENNNSPMLDEVKMKIEKANNFHDLINAADLARTLSEDERKEIRPLYKQKEVELSQDAM